MLQLHSSVTVDRVVASVEQRRSSLDDPGFCILCGVEAYGVEPDARRYPCESCGADQVYGDEELLLHLVA